MDSLCKRDGSWWQRGWEGVPPGSVAGSRAATSPIHRRAGGPQPHRQQSKMTLQYLLNKAHKARESPASFIHHWP